MPPIPTVAIIGAGSRGLTAYGEWIVRNPERAKVVAVAEPREFFRTEAVTRHRIAPANVFADWRDLLDRPRLADAVIIATTERLHTEPALLAARKGYHILLEKPMASRADECVRIVEAARRHGIILAVAHVLRYAPVYVKIKEIIDSGQIGELCAVQHMEGVAWWHQAHSFVRGNFGNEARSSFLLLAKSCHDIDVLRWWVGRPCRAVSSFGHLRHFRPAAAPSEAADRCRDCPHAEDRCPYSAKRFYFEKLREGAHGWPLAMVVEKFTEEALTKALREGPYGRCVYRCDNDVLDTQVVNLDFEGDISVSFVLSAFTPHGRRVRVMGSRGYLEREDQKIRILDFLSGQWSELDINTLGPNAAGGHGGGDEGLMDSFISALSNGNTDTIRTGPDVTLESHLICFAAEQARKENRVVNLGDFYAGHHALRRPP